jgi:NAD(P)-dependent dehydrogenase (short-subunit alcohol dehydrogenase family)
MKDFTNKTAFITGAASGIGLALATAMGKRGANVMLADIDGDGLERVKKELSNQGMNVDSVVCNVADAQSVQDAADATIKAFGKVHIVANNAGVSLAGSTGKVNLKDWRWIVDINLMGVVYGVEIFTPLLLSHGEGGYLINTASMAGHFTMPKLGPYNATKYAVVGYSESLQQELTPLGVDVCVLCPTWIKTQIHNTGKKRPSFDQNHAEFESDPMYQAIRDLIDNGLSPDALAELTLEAMAAKRFYVFTDPEARAMIDVRRDMIAKDYDACLASPILNTGLPTGKN